LFADVAAVHALDKEEIGSVILIENVYLFFSKLPIMTNIAVTYTDSPNVSKPLISIVLPTLIAFLLAF
jgi:hypothetical protein